ncbi:ABC transporter permease [Paludisphaera borealis]|uniref:Transport permease protein n=1 Tax=Paludisphaera borealis TaxID=1387353 RepID=A0A1U7CUN7_9BACT|nr:ABC transporter permease [Paludisphaera borealis]APW62616.1 Inner membrane transport permease YbhR [Paludisphaera borealis]
MLRNSPFFQLYLARLREFVRQPARIFWVYGFPMLLAVVLGFAFQNRPPAPVQADLVAGPAATAIEKAVADHNARAAAASASARGIAPIVELSVHPEAQALHRLKTGKTPIVINPDGETSWTYQYDPTRPEAASARLAIDDVLQQAAGRTNPRATTDVLVTEPGSRYIDFLIPGLIGINAMGGGLWGVGFFLVNMRIGKLLKCFVATPMPRRDFLGAILASRLTFLIPDLAVLLLLGVFAYRMPIHGSLLLVIVLDVIGALAFAGIGLLVASRASSTETVSGLMNLVMLPMWLFSGVFFASERFPSFFQPFIQALPLTQLVNALRLVILEGAGLDSFDVLKAIAILAAWAIGTFWLALRLFKWT